MIIVTHLSMQIFVLAHYLNVVTVIFFIKWYTILSVLNICAQLGVIVQSKYLNFSEITFLLVLMYKQ